MLSLLEYEKGILSSSRASGILGAILTEGPFSAQEALLYATKNNVTDHAEKVLYLLDRPEERVKIGKFGKRSVEDLFEWRY